MRPRDFERVTSSPCDVLIVGGTYQGLAISREAAERGLRATLIEPLDFGADVPPHQGQVVRGGLHLLRRGRIGRARRAVRARRRLARMAPWLIRPLPFLEATRRTFPANRIAWRGVFKLDDWIGRRRNEGVEPELHLPSARLVSKAATLRLFPGVRGEGLTGGIQWYDYQILESHRFAVALAAGGEAAGAELLNHAEVLDVTREGTRIVGVKVRDAITGTEASVRSAIVIVAGDTHSDRVPSVFGLPDVTPTQRRVSLTTSKPASDIALVATGAGGRRLTLMPSSGRALIIITLPLTDTVPQGSNITNIAELVALANDAFPALGLTPGEVNSVHVSRAESSLEGSDTAEIAEHGSGLISVTSANAASALDAATQVVRLAARRLGKRLRGARPEAPLPGGGIADHEALLIETARNADLEVPSPVMRHLISGYAERSAEIVRLMASDSRMSEPLSNQSSNVAAEIVHAIRHEKAVRLGDIVTRRLRLQASGAASQEVLKRVAEIAAQELDWDAARVKSELEDVSETVRPVMAW